MNEIKRHLLFRFHQSGGVSIALLVFFALSLVTNQKYTRIDLEQSTFEQLYGMGRSNVFLIFFMLILFTNLFIMYRNYLRKTTRWLLLPQSHMSIVFGDSIWILILLASMLILQYGVYAWMFERFINIMDEKEIVNFYQTRSVYTSISRSAFSVYYPSHFFGMLKNILLAFASATMVSSVTAQLLQRRFTRFYIWIGGTLCIAYLCTSMFARLDILACMALVAIIAVFMKMTMDCWNHHLGG